MKKMSKTARNSLITYGIVILAYVGCEIWMRFGNMSSLMEGLLVPLCVYAILAVSLNLTVGILGELSLGHAGFMCVGAFASATFTKCMEQAIPIPTVRFIIAVLIGVICAGICGILVGIPVLRLRGDYLAIVTLAFGEIIKNLVNAIYLGLDSKGFHFSMKSMLELNMEADGMVVINGAQGITGAPSDTNFTRGINITKYKIMAFSISAAMAGAAGVLYAHNLTTLTALPKNFGYNMSITILVFVVLGGIGSIRGSMISAVILTMLPEMLRSLDEYRMLIYAVVLIAAMILTWSPKAIELRERYSPMKLLRRKEKEVQ